MLTIVILLFSVSSQEKLYLIVMLEPCYIYLFIKIYNSLPLMLCTFFLLVLKMYCMEGAACGDEPTENYPLNMQLPSPLPLWRFMVTFISLLSCFGSLSLLLMESFSQLVSAAPK